MILFITAMEHKQTEPAPNELFLNPMKRASHYETGPGSYSVQDVNRSRASWGKGFDKYLNNYITFISK